MRVAVLSSSRWASFRLSKQQVSLALAEAGHDVLYVDPPLSPLSLVRDRSRWRDLLGAADSVEHGVRVWRPRVLPGQNAALPQRVNGRALARGVQRRLGTPDLVVAFSLESRGALAHLPGRRVYYCTDSAEDLPGDDAGAVRRQEAELVDRCDAVVACSLPLVEQLRDRGSPATYLPHGCDREAFAVRGEVPAPLAGRPRPFVGYVGSVNFRIDVELLEAARQAAGGGTLVVVGGSFGPAATRETQALLERTDVVTMAQQSAADLAAITAQLDVGLAPYADLAFNRKSFPLKIPQYLAAGVPVVSTPNGATDELGTAVHVAEDAAGFGAAVRRALTETEGGDERRRLAAARPWSVVAAELLSAAGLD